MSEKIASLVERKKVDQMIAGGRFGERQTAEFRCAELAICLTKPPLQGLKEESLLTAGNGATSVVILFAVRFSVDFDQYKVAV
jgi:hypothetical protein